jgi:predicted aspartyl protease
MKSARTCIAFAVILASCVSGDAISQPQQSEKEKDSADRLFQSGKFAEAGKLYAKIVAQSPKDHSATLQLGRIALLSNRLDEAQKWLEKTISLQPDDTDAKVMLAEVFYRRDDFQRAAATLNGVDVSTNKLIISQYPTLNVAKLESFKGQTPYEVQGDGTSTHVKFVKTDPLPVLNVRVNGGDEVTFFIDTGGSEVALDTDFAKELGVPQFGAVQGTFSGGQHAEVQQGRIDSLTIGDWTIKNLPVAMLPLRQLSNGLGVKRIDGIIGTTLFYHFLATMDYPRGELVLRRKTAKNLQEFKKSAGKRVTVPIWMASDHFMVGWGRVETLPPTLLFVDTGLVGAGVKLAESVIKEAGIKLEEDKATEGSGGGGTLKIVPYTVHHLSFGDIKEQNVPGLYDGPFPWENTFGFHLAGMVGHDFFKPYAVTFDFQKMQIFLQ